MSTAPPNASGQTPAFEGQTRVPEVHSGFDVQQEVIASGLSNPWSLVFLPDDRLLVTERNGQLRIVSQLGEVSPAIAGVPEVMDRGQGGLLDVSLAPDFEQTRMIYFSYSEPRGDGNGTSVASARLSDDEQRLENLEVIFRQTPSWNTTLHFGSRLVWDNEGHLFVTLGERSDTPIRTQAQDPDSYIGKVIRINRDGSSPQSNPFTDGGGASEVWSYGHRNVQAADLHPQTGELWTIEHGPRGGDELNRPEAGKNYGWPVITYGEDYSGAPIGSGITAQEGMEQPIYFWDPVIAPSSMLFYQGSMFEEWQNDIIITSLNPGGVVRLYMGEDRVLGEERFLRSVGRVRDIAEADDGALWIAADSGDIIKLTR